MPSVKLNQDETTAEMHTFVTRDILYDDARTTALEHACYVVRKVCWDPFRLVFHIKASTESTQLYECVGALPNLGVVRTAVRGRLRGSVDRRVLLMTCSWHE